ncbi:MAG: MoaD/ThiS family protein [Promethearchaeota archaeon]
MQITVKLYGDLRMKAPNKNNLYGMPNTLTIKLEGIKTIFDILNKFNISIREISHIFLNGVYSNVQKEVKEGDRIGIFPRRMGLIFEEIKSPF